MQHINFLNSSICSMHQIITSSQDYIICSLKHSGNIEIWSVNSPLETPVILVGHHGTVVALALAHQPKGNYLCSCSCDNVILWDLFQNNGHPERGKVLLSNVNLPSCVLFTADNSQIIICCESEIFIYNLSTLSCSSVISLTSVITDCQLFRDSIIVTIDEDSYLKGWNMNNFEQIGQKLISPGFPCAMSSHCSSNHVAIATSTGYLHVFGNNFSLIRNFRIQSLVKASLDKNIVNTHNSSDALEDFDDVDCNAVLCLHIFSIPHTTVSSERISSDIYYTIVVTTTSLIIMNLNIEECVYFFNFMEPALIDESEKTLGLIRLASIAEVSNESAAYVALVPAFGKSHILLKLLLNECCNKMNIHIQENKPLSFLSSETAPEFSYLKIKTCDNKKLVKSKKASSVNNNPLTFHSKIKSSGYGSQQRSVMFRLEKPKVHKPRPSRVEFSSSVQRAIDDRTSFDLQKPELLSKCCINNSASILTTKLSVNGRHVLCGNNDGTTDVAKLEKGSCSIVNSVSCHQGSVHSVNWSHCGKIFVTSGADRTVKLWGLSSRNQIPLLNIGSTSNDKERRFGMSYSKDQNIFEDGVTQALFYYLDQFILLSSRNNLFMYSYCLKDHKTELKRINNLSYCKLRVKVPVDCQRITALAAVNQFFSNLVLCSGTSKSLDVLDMNTAQVVWHADDVSSKPPYLISLNEGSVSSQQSTVMHDIFVTSSLMDGVKLWDLRTKSPIIKYHEHTATTFPCGLSFSACGKYIATGSEDKAMYIYDLRSTTSLCKLCDPTDVVTAAMFHPTGSQILAAALNGVIYLYGKNYE